jgi:haloalkane dehalogenase
MAYTESGIGPTMIFIHGWPMQKETFLPLTRILQRYFRCISFDLIDIGDSRPATVPTSISFDQQVAALKEAIAALGLDHYALVGQNSGGFIARLLAEDNPKVTNVILFNTEIPWLIPPWVPLFQMLAPLPLASHIFRLCVSTRMIARSPLGFGGCFADKDLIHGEFFSLTAQPLIASGVRRTPSSRWQRHGPCSSSSPTKANSQPSNTPSCCPTRNILNSRPHSSSASCSLAGRRT